MFSVEISDFDIIAFSIVTLWTECAESDLFHSREIKRIELDNFILKVCRCEFYALTSLIHKIDWHLIFLYNITPN